MNKQQTVTINGVTYDAHTGMRVEEATPSKATPAAKKPTPATAHALHTRTQRATTLSRKHVKIPVNVSGSSAKAKPAAKTPRSPMIRKFAADVAPSQKPKPTAAKKETADIAPAKHPVQHAVAHKTPHPTKAAAQPKPAKAIKHQAMAEAMHKAAPAKQTKKPFLKRHPRLISVASASLALVLLAGYFTYLNLPSLSVRVAAMQAGINASYPGYQPSGYSLRGPVAFSDGQVSMRFAANAGPQGFTVNQVKSTWNSAALLDNYIEPKSGGDYETYSDSGVTIYVYGTRAAWVNGGLLHTIDGDAALTRDQIRRLATSM